MTREDVAEWRTWLARVRRRCDCADVPILINRLERSLAALDERIVAEPRQMRLEDL